MSLRFASNSVRGAAALDDPTVPAGAGAPRRGVVAELSVVTSASADERPAVSAPLTLYGPADVVGIDPVQIVRRSPPPLAVHMEPNYMASVEFADPALPWLFGARAPGDRLPWMMLVVVPDRGPDTVRARPGAPAPVLDLHGASTPDPAQAAAWAHVQVQADSEEAAGAALSGPDPSRARSRLLCPTRLMEQTAYVACVVPVFEAGRLAGLGDSASAERAGPDPWRRDAQSLPVYDHWRFSTAPKGDFEALARRLKPAARHGSLGRRAIAVDPVAARLQAPGDPLFAARVRSVATALSQPGASEAEPGWLPGDEQDRGRPRLAALLERAEGTSAEPVVGPPLYGAWPAESPALDGAPAWVGELNLDPQRRLAAGAGARVVQADQEPLMDEAWRQLDALMSANRRVRWAQVFTATGQRLHDRLAALPDRLILPVVAPALDRLPVDSEGLQTMTESLEHSDVGPAVLSPAFAHAARYAVRAAPPAAEPATVPFTTTAVVMEAIATLQAGVPSLRAGAAPGVAPGLARMKTSLPVSRFWSELSEQDRARASAWLAERAQRSAPPQDAVTPVSRLDPGAGGQALAALSPAVNYERMLRWAHSGIDEHAPGRPRQRTPLHPIMAHPVFADPAVERLRRLDRDWVLGGAGELAPNSVCLMEINAAFVEAFLAGANHEIARELRWRGFPTDLKGTSFRRFWPTAGPPGTTVPPPDDIAPMHEWEQALGHNPASPGGPELTVVVIKGDLLRRYPEAIVSAERGTVTGTHFTAEDTRPELFRGTLEPDITYVALRMTRAERATQGWYVVIRQPLDAPRFGLDDSDPTDLATLASSFTTSAGVADRLFRRPFQVLLHAPDFLGGPR